MNILKKFSNRICSQQGQKIGLTLLLVGIIFFAKTFAQWVETPTQELKVLENAQFFLNKVVTFISWSWVLLATLAGKFMTNDMIYGSWLHLDAYLWKLRNIAKNFANFTLLGLLLWEILQFITKKSGNIQGIITKSVVGWLLIQASWFIIAALIDVSTIATAAIWWLPTHFVDSNAFSKETIQKEIETMQSYRLKFNEMGTPSLEENPASDKISVEAFIEKIMPKNDSVAGPLVYIWASTLNIQKALNKDTQQSLTGENVITTSLLQLLAIGIYVVTLILLLITNIIRIGLLWVIIPLSPILMLMFVFWKDLGKNGIAKNFDPGVILNAIFKPVIFTGVLSIVLIFIVSMQGVMTSGDRTFTIQGTTFTPEKNGAISMEVEGVSKATINDGLFKEVTDTGKNIFANIIIYFATIFLLWTLVKFAAKSGGGTIGEAMEKSTDLIENMAKTAPIFRGYSYGAWQESSNTALKNIGKTAGVNLDYESWSFGKLKSDEEFKKWLDMRLYGQEWRDENDLSTLRDSKNFIKTTNEIIFKDEKAPLNKDIFNTWEAIFNKKLSDGTTGITEFENDGWKEFFNEEKQELSAINDKWLAILHKALGGEASNAPRKYEELKDKIYGKNSKRSKK